MFLYDKTNILEGSGIFEVDFAPSHGPATNTVVQNLEHQHDNVEPAQGELLIEISGIKIS